MVEISILKLVLTHLAALAVGGFLGMTLLAIIVGGNKDER